MQMPCPSPPCPIAPNAPFLQKWVQSLVNLAMLSASTTHGGHESPHFMPRWGEKPLLVFVLN